MNLFCEIPRFSIPLQVTLDGVKLIDNGTQYLTFYVMDPSLSYEPHRFVLRADCSDEEIKAYFANRTYLILDRRTLRAVDRCVMAWRETRHRLAGCVYVSSTDRGHHIRQITPSGETAQISDEFTTSTDAHLAMVKLMKENVK